MSLVGWRRELSGGVLWAWRSGAAGSAGRRHGGELNGAVCHGRCGTACRGHGWAAAAGGAVLWARLELYCSINILFVIIILRITNLNYTYPLEVNMHNS